MLLRPASLSHFWAKMAEEIRPELQMLFPQVAAISLTRTAQTARDTTAVQLFTTAIVTTDDGSSLTADSQQRLAQWLKARTQADSIDVVVK